jgi:nicotinate-nucleotide adenylyltransferase
MNVAFYGGSFNPPHVGHVLAVAYLTSVARFDRVLVVPVSEHAFDKRLAAFEDRIRLCQLAFARLASVDVSSIEGELPKPNYTISTIKALLARHGDWKLRVVVGADVLPEIERWHMADELQEIAPLYALGRRGFANPPWLTPILPEVSSTQVRAWCAEGAATSHERELQQLLPPAVLEAIRRWGLYQSE